MLSHHDREFPVTIFLMTLFGATLIGAGIGLLFAPYRGATLRRRLKRYADRAVEDALESGRVAWETAIERGKEMVEDGIYKTKTTAREAWRAGRPLVLSGHRR